MECKDNWIYKGEKSDESKIPKLSNSLYITVAIGEKSSNIYIT